MLWRGMATVLVAMVILGCSKPSEPTPAAAKPDPAAKDAAPAVAAAPSPTDPVAAPAPPKAEEPKGDEPKEDDKPKLTASQEQLDILRKAVRTRVNSFESFKKNLTSIVESAEKVVADPDATAEEKKEALKTAAVPLVRGVSFGLEGYEEKLRNMAEKMKELEPGSLESAMYASFVLRLDQGLMGGEMKPTALEAVKAFVEGNSAHDSVNIELLSDLGESADRQQDAATAIEAYTLLRDRFPDSRQAKAADATIFRIQSVGKPFPFEGQLVSGDPVNPETFKGKVVIVDFWATWCGPCVAELPNLKKFYEEHKEQGLEVLGISLDQKKEDLTTFVEEKKIPWAQILPAEGQEMGWQSALPSKWGINSIPRMFIIDRAGNLVATDLRGKPLEEKVKELLAQPAPTT